MSLSFLKSTKQKESNYCDAIKRDSFEYSVAKHITKGNTLKVKTLLQDDTNTNVFNEVTATF